MDEKLIIGVDVQGDGMQDVSKGMDNIGKSTEKAVNQLAEIRKELKQAKNDMLSYAEGTIEYQNALNKAADASFRLKDINDKVKISALDWGQTSKNIGQSVAALSGGFAAAQGAMSLFGVESDKVQEALLKVTAALSITQGIGNFMDGIGNMQDLYKGLKAGITSIIISKQAETAATAVNTAANVAEAAAIEGVGAATTTTSKAVTAALGPYALIALAIAAVSAGVLLLINNLNEVPNKIKIEMDIEGESIKKQADDVAKIRLLALDYNQAVKNGNLERIKQIETIAEKEYGVHKDRMKQIGENVNNWKNAFAEYLTLAKVTYHNEALAKKKTEIEIEQSILTSKIEAARKEKARIARDKSQNYGAQRPYDEIINDAKEELAKWNDQMEDLNKVAYWVYKGKVTVLNTDTTKPSTGKPKEKEKDRTDADIAAGKKDLLSEKSTPSVTGDVTITNVTQRKSTENIIIGLNRDIAEGIKKQGEEALQLNEENYRNGVISYTEYLKKRLELLIQYNKKEEDVKALQLNEEQYKNGLISETDYLKKRLELLIQYNKKEKEEDNAKTQLLLGNIAKYADGVRSASDFISGLLQDEMEIQDNKFNKERNNLELSQEYRQADSEQQQQMMYELEVANYEKNKKTFEANKKFQIASVVAQGISSQASILATFFEKGGFGNPIAVANAALSTITNTLSTIQTVRKIASTSLDAPIPPSGGSTSSFSLAPAKSSTTSREENLNTMNKSLMKNNTQQKVLVSDINKVQKSVAVREQNSKY